MKKHSSREGNKISKSTWQCTRDMSVIGYSVQPLQKHVRVNRNGSRKCILDYLVDLITQS